MNGIYDFKVTAIVQLGDKQKEGIPQNIEMTIKAINDKVLIVDASDLSPINEGDEGNWNLRDRFFDIDNVSEELSIQARKILNNGKRVDLPEWLILNQSGVLSEPH